MTLLKGFIPIIGILLLLSSGLLMACTDQAQTDLETVYCQIKAQEPSIKLPSFNDFRRNPAKTQYFLLKRPAEQLGLALPDVVDRGQQQKASKANVKQAAEPKKTVQPSLPRSRPERRQSLSEDRFSHCRFNSGSLVCPGETYRLQRNNNRVGDIAGVELILDPPPSDTINDDEALYLQQCYELYIDAMLRVGLAEVTLSYTKFHHIYDEVIQQRGDFPQRMRAMFEFLKRDKSSMGVSRRADDYLPASPSLCQQLNSRTVVCDNVIDNWVYLTKP